MLELDIEVPRRHFTVAVALSVAAGQRLALFGPSGAGKTTVLEAVAGLIQPRAGTITLGGRVLWSGSAGRRAQRQVPCWERAVALLRQRPGLFPHLSVAENLTYSRRRTDPQELARLVELLELSELLQARPSRLSGGQAHRVALARALSSDCRALLLDEPYTGLDAVLRRRVTALVREEVSRRGLPAVLVAHELAEAQAFADTLGVLDEGRLLQLGAPHEVVVRPASRRVAELVGYQGFVERDGAIIAIHPERVRLGAHPHLGPVLSGRLERTRPAGAGFEADIAVEKTELTCRLHNDAGPPGRMLEITVIDPPVFALSGELIHRQRVLA